MELETIIGLEIHAQLSTATKLFCGCDNDAFGAVPNSRICPVCCGFPGNLPVLNRAAVEKAVAAAAAFGCEIQKFSKFDRKNYFYPDLPSGFQISQFDRPFSKNGKIEISVDEKKFLIRINRVHLENDAGKLIHEKDGTFLDFNRAGTPLIEIVTEPDLRSPAAAENFAREIQKILRFTNSSTAEMQKGMMRFDASISLRPVGEKKFWPRTEIKNLNSFAALFSALKFEENLQKNLWQKNSAPDREKTVGWDDEKKVTKILRDKESAHDYRYFPEPDLPPLEFSADEIEKIKSEIPELPQQKFKKYCEKFLLKKEDAKKISENKNLCEFFESAAEKSGDAKSAANFILSVILADENWEKTKIAATHVSDVVKLISDKKISATGGKKILIAAMKSGDDAANLMKKLGLEQNSDAGALEKIADEILAANPKIVAEFKSGKEKVFGFLMGQFMKASRGAANPKIANEILRKKLK